MSAQTKISGTWRDMTAPYIKVSNNWNIAKSAWTKIDDGWRSWFLQGGLLDQIDIIDPDLLNTFTTNTVTGPNNTVSSIAIQSDGKIVLGGGFTTFNDVTVNRIVRLNSNGTRDTAFTTNTGTGLTGNVNAIAIQSDGKIVLVGAFGTFNGVTSVGIARLNSDGTLDTAFTTNTGTGTNNVVNSIAIQSDGKIVLGGQFTTFNGATVNRIVRLNSDGTLDTAFTTNTGTGASGTVSAIAIQSDGKIVLVGQFTTFNGVTVNRIVRLNTDGTRDTAFTTNTGTGANGNVNAIAIQSDGKIVIGGLFATFNDVTVNRIVRLNSDGTLDTAFTTNTGTGADFTVSAIAIQSDGKILIGGQFTTFNDVTVYQIVRLNTDGTSDTAFTTNTGTGANGVVNSIAIQSDGKIVIGGAAFTIFNGVTVPRIARLSSDGLIEPVASAGNTVSSIAIQSDGKIVLGGQFTTFNGATVNRIVRLNSDGTLDTAFTTNTGTGASGTVSAIAIQSDGKIVLVGQFTTFNGVTVNRIVRLNTDGTRDTAFTTNTGTGANGNVNAIAIQSDGKIVIGGAFTAFNNILQIRIARVGGDIAGQGKVKQNYVSHRFPRLPLRR